MTRSPSPTAGGSIGKSRPARDDTGGRRASPTWTGVVPAHDPAVGPGPSPVDGPGHDRQWEAPVGDDVATGRRLRSQAWFDNPQNPGMTALYVERYLTW